MVDSFPKQQAALVDEKGAPAREWYDWFRDLNALLDASELTDVEVAAAIETIARALGSPDGTVAGIPQPLPFLPRTTYVTDGVGIDVDGSLATGGVSVSLEPLADTGVGAALDKITRDAYGRLEGTEAATASDLPYDNASSGLSATDVQGAIDEVAAGSLGALSLPFVYLPNFGRGSWSMQNPINGSTTVDQLGGQFASAVQGTVSGASVANTSVYTRQLRTGIFSAAGAGSAASSYNTSAIIWIDDGFAQFYRFGIADAAAVAQARMFVGVRASVAAPANADPSTFINCIGIGNDSGDTNLSIIHNDGSGTATKIDLGANFPANTRSTDFYEIQFLRRYGNTDVDYWALNVANGAIATGTITTDLPSGVGLGRTLWRNNGTTALSVRIEYGANGFAPSLAGF